MVAQSINLAKKSLIQDIQFSQTRETLIQEAKLCKATQQFEMLFNKLRSVWKSDKKASWHFDFEELAKTFDMKLKTLQEISEEPEELTPAPDHPATSIHNLDSVNGVKRKDEKRDSTVKRLTGSIRSNLARVTRFIPNQIKGMFGRLSRQATLEDKQERDYILRDIKKCKELCRQLDDKKNEIIEINRRLGAEKKARRFIKYAFVTFRTKQIRSFFFKILPKSRFQGWLSCFGTMNMQIDKRVVVVSHPPDPINVNWWNISSSQKFRVFKRVLSFTVFALLFMIRKYAQEIPRWLKI